MFFHFFFISKVTYDSYVDCYVCKVNLGTN